MPANMPEPLPERLPEREEQPLVRLAPARREPERLAVLSVLLWLWDPRRRVLLAALGGAALFASGLWIGKAVERQSAGGSQAGPALSAPVTTLTVNRPPAPAPEPAPSKPPMAPLPPLPPAPSSLMRFTGEWVGPESGGGIQASPDMAEAEAQQAPARARQQLQPLTPKTFERTTQTTQAAMPVGAAGQNQRTQQGAGAGGGQSAGGGAGPAGGNATPMGRVPRVGNAVEVRKALERERRGGGAAPVATAPKPGEAGKEGEAKPVHPSGAYDATAAAAPAPKATTTEAGVSAIGTDAGKSYAIFDGKGPHDGGGATTGSTGTGTDGGEPVKVNLGGKKNGAK